MTVLPFKQTEFPTAKLRYVARVAAPLGIVQVLQQVVKVFDASNGDSREEWRDVPTETEA